MSAAWDALGQISRLLAAPSPSAHDWRLYLATANANLDQALLSITGQAAPTSSAGPAVAPNTVPSIQLTPEEFSRVQADIDRASYGALVRLDLAQWARLAVLAKANRTTYSGMPMIELETTVNTAISYLVMVSNLCAHLQTERADGLGDTIASGVEGIANTVAAQLNDAFVLAFKYVRGDVA